MPMSDPARHIFKTYLRRLTNLGSNNRSLLVLRLVADQLMDLHELSHLNGEPSFAIIQALLAGKEKKLCAVLDSRMAANNTASVKLKKLQRTTQFIWEERGSNDLHVGWPFVHGQFADGTTVRGPLIYFPVSLEQEGAHWVLRPREEAGITFNKSFLLAYAFYNQVKLEETLLDFNFDDFETDSTVFRTQLYELLRDRLEVNFNADNFQDSLIRFETYNKSDFDERTAPGKLKLYPEAVLGIFPQAGSQLVPDYLTLMERHDGVSLEDFFLQKHREGEQHLREEKLFTPLMTDAYQEEAIKAVKRGQSIVVQGPPGTGKSQLICNLLADAIASGRKALLVCQKRAALDVVYARMCDLGLADFMGLIHDFRHDRQEIFARIARQIERLEDYKRKNNSVDAIHLERHFFQVCRRIDQLTEALEEFRQALFHEEECGLSAKELYLTSHPGEPVINIRQEYADITFHTLPELLRKLQSYVRYATRLEQPDYSWRERRSFAHRSAADEQGIEQTLEDVVAFQKELSENIYRLVGITLNLEDAEALLRREDEILGLMSILKDAHHYQFFQAMAAEHEEETSLLWLSNLERLILNCFEGVGAEVTIPADKLGQYQHALHERTASRRNLFQLIRWEWFSPHKFLVKRVLVANDLAYNAYGLQVLEQKIDNRLNLEHHLTALRQKTWLIDFPATYDREQIRQWFARQKLAIRAKYTFNTLREIREGINPVHLSQTAMLRLLRELLTLVQHLPEKKNQWLRDLTPYQLKVLTHQPQRVGALIDVLRHDFDWLCQYDALKDALSRAEQEVIRKLHDHVQAWDAAAMEKLLQNSLRLAWLEHLETKFPVLRAVSSLQMEEQQAELQRLVEEKQQLSREILLQRAREQVYETVTYNRLNNIVTYRDLYHQVTKKKKIWPVRKVISEYRDELFRLMPCWLASPESVSALFPLDAGFDLVIFDEASQCFAERGVPAMYRGQQVVVAGDDQQLRPSELYQARWEGDTADSPDLEVESLLELAARYMPTVHLQGHYRSQSLELIEFSNRHFYGQRLRLLPDREVMNRQEPAILYQQVAGVWEQQTNLVEAETVVAHVFQLLQERPDAEVGVVTFNAPQQTLILDLLEQESTLRQQRLPATLFVKNIENVQGDEKDIIIFSVGYAPDAQGRLSMQFGSLNQAGGENRLNVAVTRARERIILVTSITPEQLRTEDAAHAGPRLLRAYLSFARDVHERRFQVQRDLPPIKAGAWYLAPRLKAWGENRLEHYHFDVAGMPYADVQVSRDNRALGILLTDDERYYRSLSVKDAYAYVPMLLQRRQWAYRMIYSRNFWKDGRKLEEELMSFIGNR